MHLVMKIPKQALQYFKLTGSIGGKKSSGNMSKAERIERAKKAVAAREAKRERQQKQQA